MLIMKITELIKKELSGWKNFEIVALCVVFCLILYNLFILKDSVIAACSALCGILYTVIAGKGKISCYFFGLLGSGCYILLSVENNLWGNALLYLLYYIPMQIHGIFSWSKHLNEKSNEIFKIKLKSKQRMKLFSFGLIGCFTTAIMLCLINDKSPVFDGITTFLSVLGMYLTVKRYAEQWVIWMIVNGLSLLMWIHVVMNGTKAYSTLVMWGFYLMFAVYFHFVWRKEISHPYQG